MQERLFIIGLGNPGNKYRLTRHNIGKMFIEFLIEKYKLKMSPGRGHFFYAKKIIKKTEVYFIKTTTFMNISGESVFEVVSQFNAAPNELLIVLDDFNIVFPNLKLKQLGSDGGQNGLKSIIEMINTSQIPRLRLGIGVDEVFNHVDYVLGEFKDHEKEYLPEMFQRAKECIETILCEGYSKAMELFNRKLDTSQKK